MESTILFFALFFTSALYLDIKNVNDTKIKKFASLFLRISTCLMWVWFYNLIS